MFPFCHMCPRGILPWASSSSFVCSSLGISGPLRHRSCHPRHVSWEPSLHCILPWLLSPTAVWVSQLSLHLPVAPARSVVHCAKCEVIKTQKTPPLSWEEDWKAHICQKRQHAANFAWFESASRVCQLLCAYSIGRGMWLAWQECAWGKEKLFWIFDDVHPLPQSTAYRLQLGIYLFIKHCMASSRDIQLGVKIS